MEPPMITKKTKKKQRILVTNLRQPGLCSHCSTTIYIFNFRLFEKYINTKDHSRIESSISNKIKTFKLHDLNSLRMPSPKSSFGMKQTINKAYSFVEQNFTNRFRFFFFFLTSFLLLTTNHKYSTMFIRQTFADIKLLQSLFCLIDNTQQLGKKNNNRFYFNAMFFWP